jgi:hypothetical protein
MIRQLETFDVNSLLECYYQIEKNISWTNGGHKGRQVGLQYKDHEDPWTSAVGRSRGDELSYINLNPFFKDTVFENIIKKYNLTRTRLMWVGPYACYSMHKDFTPRIHIPIVTNPDCYFVFKAGLIYHMRAGVVYWTDTTKIHTFMNCSEQSRLHLVGIVKE